MLQRYLVSVHPSAPFSISKDRERYLSSSLDFLPGSVVRGAFATAFLRENPRDGDFQRIFGDGGNRFPFCYPGGPGARPVPLSTLACKQEPRRHPLVDGLGAFVLDRPPACCRTGACGARLTAASGHVGRNGRSTTRPRRNVRMHVGIRPETGSVLEGALYGVEVVLPETVDELGEKKPLVLCGDALFDDADVEVLRNVAARPLWFGRSRSSGLGEAVVSIEPAEQEDVAPRVAEWQRATWASLHQGTCFGLTLTSPAILVDEALRPRRSLVETVRAALGIVDAVEFSDTKIVRGWNVAASLPKSPDLALAAGTVMVAWSSLPEATLAKELAELERSGIGLRRNEGYGAVLACDLFPVQQGA